jgi:pimeloyl-ACP methyl ester carboxylesterase
MFSRDQLKRAATLTEEDFVQLGKCRRPHNRLGFAYQVAFVRLFDRFPQQQPFELFEELVCFSAAQLRLDARLIELYRKRQPTISEHQQTITGYLMLRAFDDAEAAQLEKFLFEESCRLEQVSALMGRAREFLKEQRVLEPAEIRIARIVGEQRARAREHIFKRVAALYRDLSRGPFFGFNRPAANVSEAAADSFWLQAMMGGHKGLYDCIKAFSETDFTEDLKKFDIPTLIIHGDDDQIVPIAISSMHTAKIVEGSQLKIYPCGAHGLAVTESDKLSEDFLEFINS